MSTVSKLLANLLVVVSLAGCATLGPKFEPEKTAPTDYALVYVYRLPGIVGGGVVYTVRANGSDISTLPAGGYFVYHAPPGEVELSAQTEAKTSVTIDAKAGHTYYVRGSVGIGVFIGHPHLVVVSDDVGAKEIADCKLVPGATSTPVAGTAGKSTASGPMNTAVVAIPLADVVKRQPDASEAQLVTVVDRRRRIVMERTTIGNIPLSGVVLQPSEADLIKLTIAAKLKEVMEGQPQLAGAAPVTCDLTEFSVTTPATALYWDMTTDIAVTLRVGDQQRALTGHAVKRTYAWPSESLIKTTTVEALKMIATASGPALSEMIKSAHAP